MKIFLDANILVSVLNKEYPVFPYSARIMSLAEYRHIQLYTSPICLAIAYYFAEKKNGRSKAKHKIGLIHENINVAEVGHYAVQQTLQNKAVEDFEDGLEYYAAREAGSDFIITENPEDFYFSKIPVLRSQEFLMNHVTEEPYS